MNLRLFVLAFGITIILISCQSGTDQNSYENLDPNTHKAIVEEVIQTSTYTYLRVKENDVEHWLAISKRVVRKDEILYYKDGLEMINFKSKELNKTFETIYFVQGISNEPILESEKEIMNSPHSKEPITQKEEISISPAENGITIAELFSKKETYSDKRVIIKGQVVKFNSQIMGKNWVHIQDGTNDENNYDLTITTNDSVNVGDVVTFEGKILLNKDFGAGYSYEVIMEEAILEAN